jgi:heat shock protein HslJ
MKKFVILSILIFSVFALHAGKRKKNAENLPLLHTKWILTEIYETPVIHSMDTAFIIFTDDYKISGNLGCNLFFGNFNYGKKRLTFDFLGSTRKLCMDMETETLFTRMLRDAVSNYQIEKNRLYIRNKSKVIAIFEGIPAPQ